MQAIFAQIWGGGTNRTSDREKQSVERSKSFRCDRKCLIEGQLPVKGSLINSENNCLVSYKALLLTLRFLSGVLNRIRALDLFKSVLSYSGRFPYILNAPLKERAKKTLKFPFESFWNLARSFSPI